LIFAGLVSVKSSHTTTLLDLPELDEFAEALIGQLAVELNEEKEIADLAEKIAEDNNFTLKFDQIEQISEKIFPELKQKASDFLGVSLPNNIKIEYPELKDLKKLKGRKVFTETARSAISFSSFSSTANCPINASANSSSSGKSNRIVVWLDLTLTSPAKIKKLHSSA